MRLSCFHHTTFILLVVAAFFVDWVAADKGNDDKLSTNNQMVFSVSSDDTNEPCLRARFSLKFNISYVNKQTEIVKKQVDLKSWNSYTGVCQAQLNTLSIQFNQNWSLVLNFTLNSKSSEYHLAGIELTYCLDSAEFPDSIRRGDRVTVRATASPVYHFPTQLASSYRCSSPTRVPLGDHVQLEFTDYQSQAFIKESSGDFDTAVECAADLLTRSSYMPMIVGLMLPVVVVSSYIAYVVAKKRRMTRYHHV